MSDSDEWRLLDEVIEYADESDEDTQSCAFDDEVDDEDKDDDEDDDHDEDKGGDEDEDGDEDRADAERAASADVRQSDEDWMGDDDDDEDHDQDVDDATAPAYTCESIQVLTGLQCVRKRPGMYVGDTTTGQGLHQLLWQVIEEVIDLHVAAEASELRVELVNGLAIVHDDGAGIPVDIVPEPSGQCISALERVFTSLLGGGVCHGRRYRPTGGMHGVGLAAVNALCERLEVETTRDGVRWAQSFSRGERVTPLRRIGPSSREGTTIRIKPDPEIFTSVAFDHRIVAARVEQLAWLYPHLRVWFQEHRLTLRGGIAGWVRKRAAQRGDIEMTYVIQRDIDDVHVELAFAWNATGRPLVRSFANCHATPLGGPHVNALWPAFGLYAQSLDSPAKHTRHVREAIGCGLVAIVHVQLPDPHFGSYTRDRLMNEHVGDVVREAILEALDHERWWGWSVRNYLERRLLVPRG